VKAENYLSKHADDQLSGFRLGFSVASKLSWCSETRNKRKCSATRNLFVKHKSETAETAANYPASDSIEFVIDSASQLPSQAESCATSRSLVIELIDSNCDDAQV
jgi:hypothetical protein